MTPPAVVEEHWRHDLILSSLAAITVADVVRACGADSNDGEGQHPRAWSLAQDALAEGSPLLSPAVAIRWLPILKVSPRHVSLEGGKALTGPLPGRQLAKAAEVAVALCTIGPALELHSSSLRASDPAAALALDAVGSAAVARLTDEACEVIRRRARASGQGTTTAFGPGLPGWPVDPGQREVFSIMDGSSVGVTLSPSQQMVPLKSLSFVVGVGPGLEGQNPPCRFCQLGESCRHRLPPVRRSLSLAAAAGQSQPEPLLTPLIPAG